MPGRTTKCVRIKVDCTIEFDHEFDSLPGGLGNVAFSSLIGHALAAIGAVNVLPGATKDFSLHFPRPEKKKLPVANGATCHAPGGNCVNHGACNRADRCMYAPEPKAKKPTKRKR